MTTKLIHSPNRVLTDALLGFNQLPALFNNNWFNTVFADFDKSLPKAFDVPNVHYPYDILVRHTTDTNTVYEYEIQVALAGLDKDEIRIKVKDARLNIEIDPQDPEPPSDHLISYLRNGISYRKAALEFSLAKEVDIKNITSKFKDGLLKVTIPITSQPSSDIVIDVD
jgi:HSP20 family molecular chaperone IbpA